MATLTQEIGVIIDVIDQDFLENHTTHIHILKHAFHLAGYSMTDLYDLLIENRNNPSEVYKYLIEQVGPSPIVDSMLDYLRNKAIVNES